jgi:6-pyruvoyltetrahydropterin/6-carboxytetrahydropterin synthase
MTYRSTKTYGHDVGLSCCFRQWRADSHCNQLHGYALAFTFVFEADALDHRNWVMDFGGLKALKAALQKDFDHQTAVAADDPQLKLFVAMQKAGLCTLAIHEHGVGCEAFARHAAGLAQRVLDETGSAPRVRLVSVECREHGANSAIYLPGGST